MANDGTVGDFEYDMAISFCAEDEAVAAQIVDLLGERYRCFLYSREQRELAGRDGEYAFNGVFNEKARVVVVLLRAAWGETAWTRIEQTAIRNRGFDHGYDFSFFVRMDD